MGKGKAIGLLLAGTLVSGVIFAGSADAAVVRAGTAPFLKGQAGIYVPLSPPVPGTYTVVVQATNTAGYSTTDQCTYFNVLKEKPHQFEVQHKRCKDGTPIPLDVNVTLRWILATHKP